MEPGHTFTISCEGGVRVEVGCVPPLFCGDVYRRQGFRILLVAGVRKRSIFKRKKTILRKRT